MRDEELDNMLNICDQRYWKHNELSGKVNDLERRLAALERRSEWRQGPVVAERDAECAGNCESALRQLVTMTAERDALKLELLHRPTHSSVAAMWSQASRNTDSMIRDGKLLASATAERDAARDLLTDAEHTRDMALSRVEEVERERDDARRLFAISEKYEQMHQRRANALQARLDALATREPTEKELNGLMLVMEASNVYKDSYLDGFHYVRDALLASTVQANDAQEVCPDDCKCHDRDPMTVQDGGMFAFNEPASDTECSGIPRPSPSESAKQTCERCNPVTVQEQVK